MTQTQPTRITFAEVRPGMTVTTYSGRPLEVTAVRTVTRRLRDQWIPVVLLSGWAGAEFVRNCAQLPERSTRVLDVDHQIVNARTLDCYDAIMARRTHTYADRFVELDTCVRIV